MLWHHRDDEQRASLRLDEDGRLSIDRDGEEARSYVLTDDDVTDLEAALGMLRAHRRETP